MQSIKIFFVIIFASAFTVQAQTLKPGEALIKKTQDTQPMEYEFAVKQGAEISITPDGQSYYVFWKPANFSDKTPVIVSLHGHGSWTVRDFYMWYPFIQQRGYAILDLQWWKGGGEKTSDYLRPEEIYRAIDQIFRAKKVRSPALLQGFSRGSANTYAVAALDVKTGNRYFDCFIANAGKADTNYPPNQMVQNGQMGTHPLSGTHWITIAGGKDPNPERDGIPAMRETQTWLQKYGAKVVLAIEDPNGDHGVFHRNPKNVDQALDAFENLITHEID